MTHIHIGVWFCRKEKQEKKKKNRMKLFAENGYITIQRKISPIKTETLDFFLFLDSKLYADKDYRNGWQERRSYTTRGMKRIFGSRWKWKMRGMIKVHNCIEMPLWSLSICTASIPIKFYVKDFKMDHMFLSLLFCDYLLGNGYSGGPCSALEWSEGSCRENL